MAHSDDKTMGERMSARDDEMRQDKPPKVKKLSDQVKEVAAAPPQQFEKPIHFDQVVSTGSTLLDLAISGGVTKYGGLPGRIIVQMYGRNSSGKTTFMAEVLSNVQRAGGAYRVRDPEARLNAAYCQTFGVKINQEDIERTGTITDMFEGLIGPLEKVEKKVTRNTEKAWTPDPGTINIYAVDSLAALASKMELEQGDKLGQKRAKDFSEGFRLISDHIYNYNILMFCTDQLRDKGTDFRGNAIQDTGGGNAVGYYASLRVGIKKTKDLFKDVKLPGMEKARKEAIGMEGELYIRKSSLDRPWRRVPFRLIFNYGIDDIGANLLWLKEHGAMAEHPTDPKKKAAYVIGDKNFISLDNAITYVEANDFENDIKEWVVDVWNQIEEQLKPSRKGKVR